MKLYGRSKQRSFTRNIFTGNTHELRDALLSLTTEADDQAHREINRRVHNFLAGAKTLIDHTRAFMNEFYEGTPLRAEYEAQKDILAADELCRFVGDLRNYSLHRDLPVHILRHSYDRRNGVVVSVEITKSRLEEWGGWSAPGKRFLANAGAVIDPLALIDAYSAKIEAHQDWLDASLGDHHAIALQELEQLNQEKQRLVARLNNPPPANT